MDVWTGKSVVIVDDMEHVRSELETLYRRLGFQVAGTARDGLEGLELVESTKPDLVSLDIIMPVMDGIECYFRLIDLTHPPKVLFVTCLATEPKFVDSYKNRIPEELFMPKGSQEQAYRSRLTYLFGEGAPLLSDHSTTAEMSDATPARRTGQQHHEPAIDFDD